MMVRPDDCLATAVAALLGIQAIDLPHTGRLPWEEAYMDLRRALADRGWRIAYTEWPGTPDDTLADVLAVPGNADWDEIELAMQWIVSVGHPSFQGVAHALVIRGSEVLFDPAEGTGRRPPHDELKMLGSFLICPIDPSAFTFRKDDVVTMTSATSEQNRLLREISCWLSSDLFKPFVDGDPSVAPTIQWTNPLGWMVWISPRGDGAGWAGAIRNPADEPVATTDWVDVNWLEEKLP